MKMIQEAVGRLLRGPHASALLGSLGIDPRRYWLLVDLFGLLSERGEMLDQLGANGVALRVLTLFYAAFFAFLSFVMVVARLPLAAYLSAFLIVTAVLLLSILLSEAGNSLMNPMEGLVLAHQPVDGATYTAAKLTHLARIVLYLVPAMNAFPALAGLMLKGSGWSFPLIHLLAALAVGLVAGLLCCALYGWLLRLLPVRRLRAAGQLAGTMPFLAVMLWHNLRDSLPRFKLWLPTQPGVRWILSLALGAAAAAILILGIRSLSSDYLIRVSGILHGSSAKLRSPPRSWIGEIVARVFGGQPGRAGYDFVSRMMRRDFQFRRQSAQFLVFGLIGFVPSLVRGWRSDPFSGRFTTAHLLPHILGFVLLSVATILPYGNDFKGSWIFLLPPSRIFGRFARGVYAALWIQVVVIPHLILLMLFAWPWGIWHAALFTGYSLAASSLYLALVLRLIDGVPFSNQWDSRCQSDLVPLMAVGGSAAAIAVALQYLFVFRSPAMAVAATAGAGLAAYVLTRTSLSALEESILLSLGRLSGQSGTLYKEIDI